MATWGVFNKKNRLLLQLSLSTVQRAICKVAFKTIYYLVHRYLGNKNAEGTITFTDKIHQESAMQSLEVGTFCKMLPL